MSDSELEKRIEGYSRELGEAINSYIVNSSDKPETVDDKMSRMNLNHKEKDHELKMKIAYFLIGLLSVQVVVIFILIFFQGLSFHEFSLDNYIFYILISGTLIESYFLVKIVVQHLFPENSLKT